MVTYFKVAFVFLWMLFASCKSQNNTKKDIKIEQQTVQTKLHNNNPVIRHIRTADPSAHVWKDGKVWMYTSHDMEDAVNYDSMDGYHAFSSTDMINWKDHGEVLHSKDISWGAIGWMWAPTAIYKNNKYYLIYPHSVKGSKDDMRCGVAVSDVPEGPFKDLGWIEGVEGQWLDPCVFTDGDGKTYLYWGVREPKVARLKDNLLELAEKPRTIEYGNTNFFEASYMHKRNGKYYFSYNAGLGGFYGMADNPYGPFEYKGAINPKQRQDHHSVVNYRGQNYFFYHWQNWNGGSKFSRNVAIEYLYYNEDGTIKKIYATNEGVKKVE
ncbi:family 43 glycosylhydrolase [Siansivirga zeaxanthinifaciens]|uniref:Glycosyl hydrolase family 43 n=1 Tax=Siansivirga zeaxanthinifaciens CC-SAMT-1 TaxID=1454006 RepID=A0A0C5WH48_9FLAO|nr:family 43 glycosylhydrolase [Siansivirga zeaxanthinifaciens]AJR04479.1 glycosyl hydrolase family 43 [Siansivirga zeaxanthinifaciens CC-SAMT-1]